MTQTVKRDYEAVNKDNNFIYNDLVPDFGTLEPPGKATLAKPVQFTSPAANFVDLFASLVPLAVSHALQVTPWSLGHSSCFIDNISIPTWFCCICRPTETRRMTS